MNMNIYMGMDMFTDSEWTWTWIQNRHGLSDFGEAQLSTINKNEES
jgi:hypothetical protein